MITIVTVSAVLATSVLQVEGPDGAATIQVDPDRGSVCWRIGQRIAVLDEDLIPIRARLALHS